MFLNHTKDFTPNLVTDAAPVCALDAATLLETPQGWRNAATITVGDVVATLDGGFAKVTRTGRRIEIGRMLHVPHGALDNCTDLLLPEDQHVALCTDLHEAPYVLARVGDMVGFRGIRPVPQATGHLTVTLGFYEEEIVFAQTGALIHAPAAANTSYFKRLPYGETRATLILLQNGLCGPDMAA